MLSKEEISKLKINVFNQCDDETIRLVAEMLKHTEQLESDKHKLIEKLVEDIKIKEQSIELEYEEYKEYYARTGGYPNQMKLNVFKLTGEKNKSEEILSILKGENDEH